MSQTPNTWSLRSYKYWSSFLRVAKAEPIQKHRGGPGRSAEAFEGPVLVRLLRTSRGSHHTETSRLPHLDFLDTR